MSVETAAVLREWKRKTIESGHLLNAYMRLGGDEISRARAHAALSAALVPNTRLDCCFNDENPALFDRAIAAEETGE